MSGPSRSPFELKLDPTGGLPLAEQIHASLRAAILGGRIAAGARLPSWRDLATQLGVSRGTVRAAYDRLADEMLVVAAGAAGTRVAAAVGEGAPAPVSIRRPLDEMLHAFSATPLPFQMGVPAQDAFPAKIWARARLRAVREDALGPVSYADPRGQPALREQLSSYLAMARGIACVPDQILITGGFRPGLSLALRALDAQSGEAWIEDPAFPLTRRALEIAGLRPLPIAVDEAGLVVDEGLARAPDARLALVTPGQQAPTGVTLAPARRRALLDWAEARGGWIIEDDYLSELQLEGRPAPALFAEDAGGRVIHVGSFSKTLSPSLGLGFVVAPLALAERFGEVAGLLAPAPNITTQMAVAQFMADGHYLRHLRHMKRLYAERRDALVACLARSGVDTVPQGLAALVPLAKDADDVGLARRALRQGVAPTPLSPWYAEAARRRPGLLLSVTNVDKRRLEEAVDKLLALL